MTQPDNAAFAQSQEQKQRRKSHCHSIESQFHSSQRNNHSDDQSVQTSQGFEKAYQTEDQSKVFFLASKPELVSPNFPFLSPPLLLLKPAF
jgi:hypothetical protein